MIVKVNKDHPTKNIIQQAVHILEEGGVLIAPTETAYGLVCDATDISVIKKIVEIKKRPENKFFPLVVASIQQLQMYFELNDNELELVKRYLGLSIILNPKLRAHKKDVALMPGQEMCAVRITTNNLMRNLAKKLGRPIVATSANIAGGENCYDIDCMVKQIEKLEDKVGVVLDAGVLQKNKPSTIVKVEGKKVKVVRQGEIKINKSKK